MLALASRRAAVRVARSMTLLQREFQSSSGSGQQAHPKPVALSKLKDSFLDGTSSTYLEELEQKYRQDPKSVDRTWASFFRSMGAWGDGVYFMLVLLCVLVCSCLPGWAFPLWRTNYTQAPENDMIT